MNKIYFIILIIQYILVLTSSNSLFGFITRDNVILSSSGLLVNNELNIKSNYQWIKQINQYTCIGLYGDQSDCEYIYSLLYNENNNNNLYYNNDLSTKAISYLCRGIIGQNIRKNSFKVNILIAGWDKINKKPRLFWLDNIGSLQEIPYGSHGNDFMFIISLLDHYNMILKQSNDHIISKSLLSGFQSIDFNKGVEIVKEIWHNINKRTSKQHGKCQVISIDKDGCREINLDVLSLSS